jgi:hypothetical protein
MIYNNLKINRDIINIITNYLLPNVNDIKLNIIKYWF